ncbi:hypothetical protein ACTMTJ_43605 [Phytohabitans sp. LJ34]|uniref:hypothetical protein n=1 Tax=Phytohabitans sp. LJ34 TaxID=3452217 RepID=UPI003F8BBB9B
MVNAAMVVSQQRDAAGHGITAEGFEVLAYRISPVTDVQLLHGLDEPDEDTAVIGERVRDDAVARREQRVV